MGEGLSAAEVGKEIKHQQNGHFSSGFADTVTTETTYGLAKKVKKLTVKVTYFEKIETLSVPINQEVGVGF